HARQLADPPSRFLEEVERRRAADARRRRWNVDRQYLSHVITGIRSLQCSERGDQHAGARKQHERACDLDRRKDPQAAVRACRHTRAAASQPKNTQIGRTTLQMRLVMVVQTCALPISVADGGTSIANTCRMS